MHASFALEAADWARRKARRPEGVEVQGVERLGNKYLASKPVHHQSCDRIGLYASMPCRTSCWGGRAVGGGEGTGKLLVGEG
jgi:hypothetical protein